MTFKELLIKWNNGFSRGGQAKLAKILNISEPTIARWADRKLKPSEIQIRKMAKLFNISEEELRQMFMPCNNQNVGRDNNGTMTQSVGVAEAEIKELTARVEQIGKDVQIMNLKMDLMLEKMKDK